MNINIRLVHVSKSYENNQILDDISYQFIKSIYHVVGSNGIGKSTLLRLLVGLDLPDSGMVIVNDYAGSKKQQLMTKNIHYVPDDLEIYPFLTGQEFINWIAHARSSNTNEVDTITDAFRLKEHLNTKISNMSFGTKKKFLLTTALIGVPDFIILDEPMNGLDKNAQLVLLKILEQKSKNSGIILTCHDEDKVSLLLPKKLRLVDKKLIDTESESYTYV